MSTDVLADLAALRRRTRDDRHAYAFPLFLFGALILLAPLLYASYPPPAGEVPYEFTMVPVASGPFPPFDPIAIARLEYRDLVGWYWVMAIIGGLALTVWWYRHRARRHGVETDTRLAVAAVVAGLVGFLVWPPLFSVFGPSGLYSRPGLNLTILFGSTALAVVALLWSRRRTAGVAVAAFLAVVAFGAVGVYLIRGYAALVIIAAVLLVLAWAERSVLLAVVGVLFTAVALVVNLYNVENVFQALGWYGGWDQRATALQSLLLPGVVLLAGGVAAVIGQRR